MPKSFISTNYIAFIPANRNTFGISYKGENIRLTGFGFKSASEVNCHGIIICRQADINVSEYFTICPVIILFAHRQLNGINSVISVIFQINAYFRASGFQHLIGYIGIYGI